MTHAQPYSSFFLRKSNYTDPNGNFDNRTFWLITFVDIKRNGKPPALLSQRHDKQQMERPKRARDTEVVTRGEK